MRGLLGGRCLTVCSAVLVSLGTGILAPATRGEAAAKKPTAVSVTLEATSAGPDTVLAALDNGLVVSGRCRSLTSTVEVSLKLAPEAGFPPGMQVSGFSFVGVSAHPCEWFHDPATGTKRAHRGERRLCSHRRPLDLNGNPLGNFVRIDIQGSFSLGPGNVVQCSFGGLIIPV